MVSAHLVASVAPAADRGTGIPRMSERLQQGSRRNPLIADRRFPNSARVAGKLSQISATNRAFSTSPNRLLTDPTSQGTLDLTSSTPWLTTFVIRCLLCPNSKAIRHGSALRAFPISGSNHNCCTSITVWRQFPEEERNTHREKRNSPFAATIAIRQAARSLNRQVGTTKLDMLTDHKGLGRTAPVCS